MQLGVAQVRVMGNPPEVMRLPTNVRVDVVVVIIRPFIDVHVATPKLGVVNEGLSNGAKECVPAGSVDTVVAVAVSVVENAPDNINAPGELGIVNVPVEVVMIKPFIDVHVAVLREGLPVNAGLSSGAKECVPAGSVDTVVAEATNVVENAPDNISAPGELDMVSVPVVVEIIKPFMDVHVATPRLGVIKDGLSSGAKLCVPAGSVDTVVAEATNVVENAPDSISAPGELDMVSVPVVVLMIKPFIDVHVATPRLGVMKDGLSSGAKLCIPAGSVDVHPGVAHTSVIGNPPDVIRFPTRVNVEVVVVIIRPLSDVHVATPRNGVINDGLSSGAKLCIPAGSVDVQPGVAHISVIGNPPDVSRFPTRVNVEVVVVMVRPLRDVHVAVLRNGLPVKLGLSNWARECVPEGNVDTVVAEAAIVTENPPETTNVAEPMFKVPVDCMTVRPFTVPTMN